MTPAGKKLLGVLGALIYAGAGACMGARNAGWFDLDRNSNGLMPAMGIGAGLVVLAFVGSSFSRRVADSGAGGKTARILLAAGPLMYVLSQIVEFAIIGTLTLGIGLICLAVIVTRHKLVPTADRILIILSAIGSVTWNTETVSAFLLVGVGIIWAILSLRLIEPDRSEG